MSKLYLLPNLLGDLSDHHLFLPAALDELMPQLDGLIAESEKGGRRYLSRFKMPKPVHQIPIALLNEHTKQDEYEFLLEPVKAGEKWGIVSDAGLPCIADPGAALVRYAKRQQVEIEAFSGPSSIFLALMLSGLSGQEFTFHGYLPRDEQKKKKIIQQMEKGRGTQVFMEAPYRNMSLLELLLKTLSDETVLSVAWNLTLPDQGVLTRSVKRWKVGKPLDFHKKCAIFLIASNNSGK